MKLPNYHTIKDLMQKYNVAKCKIFGPAANQAFPTRAHLHILIKPGQGCDFVHKNAFEKALYDLLADENKYIEFYTKDALKGWYKATNRPEEEVQKILAEAKSIAAWIIEKKEESITNEDYPLHYAVKTNNINEVAEILTNSSDSVNNLILETRRTALHIAAKLGLFQIACLLIENKADVSIKDINEKTPYEIARDANHTQIASLLQDRGTRQQSSSQEHLVSTENSSSHTSSINSIPPAPY